MNTPTPAQKKIWWQTLTVLCGLILTLVGFALAYALLRVAILLDSVLLPLAIAGVIACLLHPLVEFFVQRGWPRARAVVVMFVLAVVGVGGVAILLVPLLIDQTRNLVEQLPTLIDNLRARSFVWLTGHPQTMAWLLDLQAKFAQEWPQHAPRLANEAWQVLGRVAGGLSFMLGLVFVPLYVFYFLCDQPKIAARWSEYVPLRHSWLRGEVIVVVQEINKYLIAFFRGQILVAMMIGILTAIGLSLIGLKYGLLIGVLTGLLSIIPYLGVALSITPTLLVAYVQGQGAWWYVLLALAVFFVVQLIEGMFISPKVMGERTGLHPLTIIISILVWSVLLGGLIGAILAIPLTATLKVLMYRYVWLPTLVDKEVAHDDQQGQ